MPVPVRLGDERLSQRDGLGDGLRHRQLLRPEAKPGQRARERPVLAKNRSELGVRRVAGHVLRQRRVQGFFVLVVGVFAAVAFVGCLGFALVAFFATFVSLSARLVRTVSMRCENSSYGFATRAL